MFSSVVLIVLAGSLFGVLHTTLAALRVKHRARGRWGVQRVDRWYRLFYAAVAGITFLPVIMLVAPQDNDRTSNFLSFPVPPI